MPATAQENRIRLSQSAMLDLHAMGIPSEKAVPCMEEAILRSGKRKPISEAQGITEAKIEFESGRYLGLLYIDEPDHTYLVARVYWTRL